MFYTLAAAAKVSGLGASAIRTAIERGQIHAVKDLFDEWQIEETELHRLYFPLGQPAAKRNDGASIISVSEIAPAGDIDEPHKQTGPAPERTDGETEADSAPRQDGGGIAEGKQREQPDALPCPASAQRAETGENALARQQYLARFEQPSEIDRYDGQLGLLGLDHTDRIAIGNAFFWESELKADDRRETLDAPEAPRAIPRRAMIFGGALIVALVLGWAVGFGSYHLLGRSLAAVSGDKAGYSAPPPANQVAVVEKECRDRAGGPSVTGSVGPSGRADNRVRRRPSLPQGVAAAPESRTNKVASVARMNSVEPISDNSGEPSGIAIARGTNDLTRRTPAAETKPTTIEGWMVRSVSNGTAVLEGPTGLWSAARGDTVPGLGRVDSIVLWGNRWIVATSRGLVTTP